MRLILWQKYWNRIAKRVEVVEEIRGNGVYTDHQFIDISYFKKNYEMYEEKNDAGCL